MVRKPLSRSQEVVRNPSCGYFCHAPASPLSTANDRTFCGELQSLCVRQNSTLAPLHRSFSHLRPSWPSLAVVHCPGHVCASRQPALVQPRSAAGDVIRLNGLDAARPSVSACVYVSCHLSHLSLGAMVVRGDSHQWPPSSVDHRELSERTQPAAIRQRDDKLSVCWALPGLRGNRKLI